jgi:hypothetical protein
MTRRSKRVINISNEVGGPEESLFLVQNFPTEMRPLTLTYVNEEVSLYSSIRAARFGLTQSTRAMSLEPQLKQHPDVGTPRILREESYLDNLKQFSRRSV